MKDIVKYLFQKLLGFKNYLFIFSLFKIYTLKKDKNENDFFHFLSLIPENTAVLDIGANIGIMSVYLARSVKNVHVYCFEPMPTNIATWKRIIHHFKLKNIQLFEFALGNREGEVEMVMPVVNSVRMQGLSHVIDTSIVDNNDGERFVVPLKMLDNMDIVMNSLRRISAIKIDVENFEYFVLDGAKKLIEKNKPIVYAELWENENRDKCFTLFDALNYKTFVISDNKMLSFEPSRHKTQNFIFLPA